jgi:hypothetical protein
MRDMNEFHSSKYPMLHTVPPGFAILIAACNFTSAPKGSDRGAYSIPCVISPTRSAVSAFMEVDNLVRAIGTVKFRSIRD